MNDARPLASVLACPSCHHALGDAGPAGLRCSRCSALFARRRHIWRLLAPGREEAVRGFVQRYEAVRANEGRRVRSERALRALPFRDLSGRRRYEWSIRARSFRALLRDVVVPTERASGRPLVVLDLGSGIGWLAHRLAIRGHLVVAVDLVTNDDDGLGAHLCCERTVAAAEAEFDRLPVLSAVADLVVFNASLHYSHDVAVTLAEALRVLAPGGRIVILDSPLYGDPASGEAMLREQGRRSGAGEPEGFLTYDRLAALGHELAIAWALVSPWYGLRWWARPWMARVRGGRPPARFAIVLGRRLGSP